MKNYYLLNTNRKLDPTGIDETAMLEEEIAAAYLGRWKDEIKKLNPGDVVFLYRTGEGIIAIGTVSGPLKVRDYRGDKKFKDGEFYKSLDSFQILSHVISPAEINRLTKHRVSFMKTLIKIKADVALAILGKIDEEMQTFTKKRAA